MSIKLNSSQALGSRDLPAIPIAIIRSGVTLLIADLLRHAESVKGPDAITGATGWSPRRSNDPRAVNQLPFAIRESSIKPARARADRRDLRPFSA